METATSFEVAFFVFRMENIIRLIYDSYDIDFETTCSRCDICLVNKILHPMTRHVKTYFIQQFH